MPQPKRRVNATRPKLSLTLPVQIAAAAGDKPRTFSLVANTGEPMRIGYYSDPVVIDLDSVDVSAQRIPALYDHIADADFIVGQSSRVAVEGGPVLKIDGTFTIDESLPAERNWGKKVLARADAGYQWQVSVGGDPSSVEEIKAGAVGKANGGRDYPGPVIIARGVVLREVSFLVLGGDRRTSAMVARHRIKGGSAMTFEQWCVGFMTIEEFTALDESGKAALQKAYDASGMAEEVEEETPAETVPASGATPAPANAKGRPKLRAARFDLTRQMEADEAERVDGIRRVCAAASNPTMTTGTGPAQKTVSIAANAIGQGWDLANTQREIELHQLRASRTDGPFGYVQSSTPAVTALTIEAALCKTLGMPNLDKKFKPEILEAADKQFRSIGLQQCLLIAAAANGYQSGPGQRIHAGNLRTVLEHAFRPIQAGFSTISLPNVFSSVADKEILQGFEEEDQSWREIAVIKSSSDFRATTSLRLNDSLEYEELAPEGEIKHGALSEETYTRQLRTYAKMMVLTRVDIINDDLGAFDDLKTRMGLGAARKFRNIFWTRFLANSSFFTAARGNYIVGATSNLLTDGVGLQQGLTAFRLMKSTDGKRIGGQPTIMLIPPELEFIADRIYASNNTGSGTTVAESNIHANKYRPIVVPWLSDPDFSGSSTTAWYLFRGGSLAPIAVSFLNGQQTPTVESTDAEFNTLGIQFRGYHDFSADFAEWLSGLKSKGAA